MATTILTVPDISCEHCQLTITKALSSLSGVRSVNVDIPSKQVAVDYDEAAVGVDGLKEILAEEDYPVASLDAPTPSPSQQGTSLAKDPVCGMDVTPQSARYTSEYEGQTYYFCSNACQLAFEDAPQQYLATSQAGTGCSCCKA